MLFYRLSIPSTGCETAGLLWPPSPVIYAKAAVILESSLAASTSDGPDKEQKWEKAQRKGDLQVSKLPNDAINEEAKLKDLR